MQIIKFIFFLSKINKLSRMKYMKKILSFLICFLTLFSVDAKAATRSAADFMSKEAYSNLYPYMNNKMRVKLNQGTSPTTTQDAVSTIARTTPDYTTGRRVVSRSSARSATTGTSYGTPVTYTTSASAGISPTTQIVQNRRVVPRGVQSVARSSRLDSSYVYRTNVAADAAAITSNTTSLSSDRCLADYIQCMNGYCEREKTEYNRCYCSAKLAQIDAKYQPEIDSLIQQILQLQNSGTYTEEEMNQYWEEKVGQYTGENSWINLDNALDINWADTESRVRGQQAFLTGHEYCSQHLQGCYYMADNMRDAYRSEISRDCAKYENSLQKVKEVAESVVENYNGD